jgi:small redox-active disulfide protein 2
MKRSFLMLQIKVLGSGCPNCQRLERETRAALDETGIDYQLTKVTEYADMLAYGVMSTPALVMNEKVVSSGRIPARSRIAEWARDSELETK